MRLSISGHLDDKVLAAAVRQICATVVAFDKFVGSDVYAAKQDVYHSFILIQKNTNLMMAMVPMIIHHHLINCS